jgi:asparagine synthase (glutamine-hydrolysing)
MVHRGPDYEWYHQEPGAGLAMRQLATNLPLDKQQCMSNEDGSVWAVVDGEIYNHVELRAYLASKGHTFRTSSTVELLTHMYEEEGTSFPESLKGVFAIAVWDRANRQLLLVRDHLGVKPLYIAHLDGTLVFASELRAAMQHPEVSREIDLMAFSEYLTFQHTIPPRTILAAVQKLPAGHVAIYREGKLTKRQYWDLVFPEEASRDLDEKRHVEQFREAFAIAVKRPLQRGVPVGAFLSGGMDSSSIVTMMSSLGAQETRTYAAGHLAGGSDGQLSHARIVAQYLGTRHSELAFTAQDFVEALPRCVLYMDDPVADAASVIRMLLAGQAREDVAVLLGGEAGDDVTGGYHWKILRKRFDRMRQFQRLPRWLRCSLPALTSPFLPRNLREWLARGNRDISTIAAEEPYAMVWAFEAEEKRRYCPVLHDVDDHCRELTRELYSRSGTADPLSQVMYFYAKTWVAESMMMSADKMLMSHSVEYRPPFLDRDLVELCAQIPFRSKIRRESDGSYTTKSILKQAMRGTLLDEVPSLPKSFFSVPFWEWVQGDLAGYCRDILLSDRARSSGYYDAKEVEMLLETHRRSATRDSAKQIRNLLFFEMWRELVLARGEEHGALR